MGEKMQPYTGEDGRLYYNYGVGAKYVFRENGKEYIFEIADCSMKNTTEYYTCLQNGVQYWNKFSANRIHYLLHFNLFETLSEGERQELPLTVDEVSTYYRRKMQERAEAFKSLGKREYSLKVKKQTIRQLMFAMIEEHCDMESVKVCKLEDELSKQTNKKFYSYHFSDLAEFIIESDVPEEKYTEIYCGVLSLLGVEVINESN